MLRKLIISIALLSLVTGCMQEKKTSTSWRQKCSVELIRTIENTSADEKIAVLVKVSQAEGAQAKVEAEGLEVNMATGNIFSGSILAKKLSALASLPIVKRIETGSKPKLLK